MIDVEETEKGLRVVDAAKNEVEVELVDWTPGGEAMEIDRDVEVTVAGAASEITFSELSVTIESAGREQVRWVHCDEKLSVLEDEHLVQADNVISTYVRVSSEITIVSDSVNNRAVLSLPEQIPVTLGFRSQVNVSSKRLRIPPTAEGLAGALTSFAHAHKTDTPDRSYPSMRVHPPLLEVADVEVMDDELNRDVELSTVLRMPRSLESLFVVSPLVYYLGAKVEFDPRVSPLLETKSIEYDFSTNDTLAEEVANLLSRVFYLDCLVRNVGPYGLDIHELDLLDEVSLDAERLYSLSVSERLGEYLDVPFEMIADEFPQWPMAVSIEPSVDSAPVIPHLLDRMSLIFPPSSRAVDECTIIERSLGDFHRSATSGVSTEKRSSLNVIEPANRFGVIHGWMAEGTPVDAFKCPPEAFANRLKYLDTSVPLCVAVILNDEEMDAEFSEVVTTYRGRAEAFSIDVEVMHQLRTNELATTLESTYDFVHYIGHCDPEGLRCHDGNLSTSSLAECNVQSFFLNACRSYHEGLELIRQGSVSGAVTIGDVLDDQARKVGTTFARLLGRGHTIQRSLRLSRVRAIMNRQYGIVGDGTHILAQGSYLSQPILSVSRGPTNGFRLRSDSCSSKFHGGVFRLYTGSKPVLLGNDDSHSVSEEQFEYYLHVTDDPLIFEQKLYWPEELLEELF